MIHFGRPSFTRKEETAILETLRSGWIGNGPKAREFEKAFGDYIGSPHCVAVSSCTIGLMLALRASQIRRENRSLRVATTPLTFAATLNAILHTQNTPIFYDVKENGNIDIQDGDYDLILPVHYTGAPCDMDKMAGKAVIEDAAHAFDGEYKGQKLGTFGDFGVFSFYPTKNITTIDGGMVVCRRKEDGLLVRILANQGQPYNAYRRTKGNFRDEILFPGFKGAMPDLNASLGIVQLRRWGKIKEKRDLIWKIYEREFGFKEKGHSHHLYTIQVEDRDKVRERLKEKGIPTGVHYKALHLEHGYKFLGYKKGDFPNAERISETTLSLPISAEMTEWDAIEVTKALKKEPVIRELVAA